MPGYKDPPAHTRFKKGKSGNPKGRPKNKVQSLDETLNKVLQRKVPITEKGKTKYVILGEAIFLQTATMALKGDLKALDLLIKKWPAINFYKRQISALDITDNMTEEEAGKIYEASIRNLS